MIHDVLVISCYFLIFIHVLILVLKAPENMFVISGKLLLRARSQAASRCSAEQFAVLTYAHQYAFKSFSISNLSHYKHKCI